ncbi:transposase [Caldicoprobacter faecalis]|nr:transposase [Caldicoprobacter faecalis]
MFRENNKHLQTSIMESIYWMNPGIRQKLEKSWAPIFYEEVFCNIDEKPFSVLYSDVGCPNFPVNILLSLEFIKHMKNLSDDELIEAFYFNYLVNYAVGIRVLGEVNLAEKTLYNFRSRIYRYLVEHPDEEDLIFGQFLNLTKKFAEKAGISFSEQRMDTTMFMSNIKKAGRLALAFDVLQRAVKAIPEDKHTDELSKVLEEGFKKEMLYKSKPSESDSRLETLLNMCYEAMNILEGIPGMESSEELRIVKRFLSEQAYIDNKSGRVKAKDSKDIPTDSLQSAYDEDATYRKKGTKGQSGYVLEIAETCCEDNAFQLMRVVKNFVSD